jgi:hypothetical protein
MPLYDVTKKPDKLIKPDDGESYEYIQKAKKSLNPKSFKKMTQTIDVALEHLRPSKESGLVWTKCGALFGYNSNEPLRDINHLWQNAEKVINDGEMVLKLVGGLLRWRISLIESDIWLMYRQDTDKINPKSGKEIKVSTYWIDNNYNPPASPDQPPSPSDLEMLRKKFGK